MPVLLIAAGAAATLLALSGCDRGGEVGILPFYPGAEIIGQGEYQGRAFGFGPADWERTDITVRAPYEQVREFYARIKPVGWTSSFTNESSKDVGRRYDRYLTDAHRREFYAIQVQEELGGIVRVNLAWGRAPAPSPTPLSP